MEIVDFSKYKLSGKYYGGTERKIGISIDENDYMIKFQKRTAFGKRNNHISEYIGSHIFELLGLDVQETYLGYYNGEEVVACRDFNSKGTQFVPFNDIGESTLEHDRETYQYDYNDIMQMLRDNSKLTNVNDTISLFWDIYIIDALLGNFDRHGSNWGFLKVKNRYSMAPVFDNGSCLFPNLTDEDEMQSIINSKEETEKRVYTFPTSQIKVNGRKSSYYDVISSLQYPECNDALCRIYERFDMRDINELLEKTIFISEIQKHFYKHMISTRYHAILEQPYEKLRGDNK